MNRQIKRIRESALVEYDTGRFDDWCVYLTRSNEYKYAPRDTEYFSALVELARKHGNKRIYDDYVKIYDKTNKNILPEVLEQISQIADTYSEDSLEIDIWFTVIYAGMVAEENKKFTKLGKRIKRLGMYQSLIEMMPPSQAAVFSKGKKWRELDAIMRDKGI